jgi:DNA-binding MarR family transcriptional regulator
MPAMPSPTSVGTPPEPVPPPALGDPAGAPREAVRALARAARLLERGSKELGMAHYRVLSAVAGGEDRASRVAEQLELGRPTVSSAVDALCRDGLLDRDQVAGDQRAVSLRLTPAGVDVLRRAEEEMVQRFEDLCARVPSEIPVVDALIWLGSALDQRQAERLARRREMQ